MTTNGHNGMNETNQPSSDGTPCGDALDQLPLRIAGRLAAREARALEEHLSRCAGCAAEVEFLEAVVRARPEPPRAFKTSVLGRLRIDDSGVTEAVPARWKWLANRWDGSQRRAAGWGLSAAALLVLALGIGVVWSEDPVADGDTQFTSALLAPEDEMVEEWMVAGAPVLDGLPDEVLLSLMTEMD